MKQLKINNKDKKIVIYLSLGLVAILILIISVTIAFFSRINNASGTINVGEIDFSIYENDVVFNSIVPGDSINKTVSIINSRNIQGTNTNNLGALMFKYSMEVYVNDEYDEDLSQLIMPINDDIFTESDGEYYYNGILETGESVNLLSMLDFSVEIDNTYQNESISVVFLIDAIQAENYAYEELWPDAPSEWLDIIESEI